MTTHKVDAVRTAVYRFPTGRPEGDGTLTWDATTAVVVEIDAAGVTGLGWTYSTAAAAAVIDDHLTDIVMSRSAMDVSELWQDMVRACRNLGRPGIVSQAIAAVDIALWDLKAHLLELPLHRLFGQVRDSVPVYGSGGFTSMSDDELRDQIADWGAAGCDGMKIKVGQDWGANPARDIERVELLKSLAPSGTTLMVDANGGYTPGQAARLGEAFDWLGVTWFEEPVSSDDLGTLASLRQRLRCDVAAGEYADSVHYVERMCAAGAVDCMQLDVTRCAGYTEWIRCAAIAAAHGLQVSAHCAPSLHAAVGAATPNLRHVEWFADHARLEPLLVDGAPPVRDGALVLSTAPGHGMRIADSAGGFLTTRGRQ
jgi:L-alanine-DL-glutamate epimerase-like enolase superfamily enzyme